ncbi:MAG: galactitol-1-phosphate 5-dehydrogenase [Lachnospiraceae bacterium]|nr:galactitol-1-phosphate 5-dehydrogenase [Candidatus Merdinaster equi]
MKAWVLHEIGNMTFDEKQMPEASTDETIVEVKAAGICGSDIPRMYTTGAHKLPLTIGHEFSGVDTQTGKRVGVFPLIPCKECEPCRNKQYEMCRHYNYLGSRCDGGFAEYVVVPKWNLIELPDEVSFEEAAMLEPMSVAVHAMRRIPSILFEAEPAKKVCIYGAGTIGILLTMFLLARGDVDVLVIGNKDFQREKLKEIGLPPENYCDSRHSDVSAFVMEKTGGNGADIFFECIGKNETVVGAVNMTKPYGEICFVGNPYSDMELPKDVYWKILRNQLHVYGTWNSSYTREEDDDWHMVLDYLKKGLVKPSKLITHKFSADELLEGFELMHEKKEDYIKVMMAKG